MDLFSTINRDFPENEKPFIPYETSTYGMIETLSKQFTNFDDFLKSQYNSDNKKVYLIDTCSLLKKDITEFQNGFYIITCGVFLEILQGATKKTINNGDFDKDIKKLVLLKTTLKNDCVFLMLGRKRRAYWSGFEPSKSCRNCVNCDTPHYKILRDIDTELYRLSIILKCKIETCDHILLDRVTKHYSGFYLENKKFKKSNDEDGFVMKKKY
jgi:hypothetical protein